MVLKLHRRLNVRNLIREGVHMSSGGNGSARRSRVAMIIGGLLGPAIIIGAPVLAVLTWNHPAGLLVGHGATVGALVFTTLAGICVMVLGFIKYQLPPPRLRRYRRRGHA